LYFGIMFIMMLAGTTLASFISFMPGDIQYVIPYEFRFLFWFVGMMMAFVGVNILYRRCRIVGANHLINPGRPGTVLWFFFYRDGECRILPCKRAGEGQLYSADLDSQIIDVKTYSLCDHKIRIVPEVVGHAVDLDYVGYVDVLKTKWGFENMRQARQGWLNEKLGKTKEIVDKEHFVVEDKYGTVAEKVDRLSKRYGPEPV